MTKLISRFYLFVWLLGGYNIAIAEPVRNGNELALEYAGAGTNDQQIIRTQKAGKLYTFRYLKIKAINRSDTPNGTPSFETVEPSSDLTVVLYPRQKNSLTLAGTLQTNDCVAVNGRVLSFGTGAVARLVVDPAILRFKDRAAPKAGAEALHEVDPTAH